MERYSAFITMHPGVNSVEVWTLNSIIWLSLIGTNGVLYFKRNPCSIKGKRG
jgi:hypothetical protein